MTDKHNSHEKNTEQPVSADKKPKKAPKVSKADEQVAGLTNDLQRMRADFENYRKRVDSEKITARADGHKAAVLQLLPVIDNIERAVRYLPEELRDNAWAKSVSGLAKNLDKSLAGMKLERIDASEGVVFNPELHEAVQFDEEADGVIEVIAEELQSGYLLHDRPLRHAMVKVTKK